MVHRKQIWAKRVKKERFRKRYLSKAQAQRLLQVDSMNFRRLTILKGVYPRVVKARSKQKTSGSDKQYYLTKEIKWLVRDQVLDRIHAFRAWEKKVKRAQATKDREAVRTLDEKMKPLYQLDATIKERYPRFSDALRDVDDALSMIALYAFLSPEIRSDTTIEFHHALPSGLHEKSINVLSRWMSFVAKSHSLNKAFISIKGYYFEAIVRGQRILWLMPHEYSSKFPSGIQQYVLITFLEFYVELMRFVLFKLEHEWEAEEEERRRAEDGFVDPNVADFGPEGIPIEQQGAPVRRSKKNVVDQMRKEESAKLFENLTFFVSKECPAKHLVMVIENCGGQFVRNYRPGAHSGLTHYIVDRPALIAGHTVEAGIEYVQPQYIFDCFNARLLLPPNGYRIGEELPPHVSPFTVSITNDPADQAVLQETSKLHRKIVSYVPHRVHEIRKLRDPNYNALDPSNVLDLDALEMSDTEHIAAPQANDEDAISLSGSEIAEARKRPEWQDETVQENPVRTKLSALQVQKQRERNKLNAPSTDKRALHRLEEQKRYEAKRLNETDAQRARRKLRESAKEDAVSRRMRLQVARKKAARYYKMVNSAVQSAKRKTDVLAAKAKALQQGRSEVSADGTTFKQAPKRQREGEQKHEVDGPRRKKRQTNPYSKLPKWVR